MSFLRPGVVKQHKTPNSLLLGDDVQTAGVVLTVHHCHPSFVILTHREPVTPCVPCFRIYYSYLVPSPTITTSQPSPTLPSPLPTASTQTPLVPQMAHDLASVWAQDHCLIVTVWHSPYAADGTRFGGCLGSGSLFDCHRVALPLCRRWHTIWRLSGLRITV